MRKDILHLVLKKKWFDLIADGSKKVEYRNCTDYWQKRLVKRIGGFPVMREFSEVWFYHGYAKNRPFMRVEFIRTEIKETFYPDTGMSDVCFCIYLGQVLEIRNM